MIPVKVEQLLFSDKGFVLLLKAANEERALPIFIGPAEAQAIAMHINKISIPRPLTHDLFKSVIETLNFRLVRIEVTDLRDGTFYANLVLEGEGGETTVDSRPSDAIALALRFDAPIFVEDKVMDEAAQVIEVSAAEEGKDPKQAMAVSPVDALKKKLEKAVEEERYEDAARIRDEIQRLEKTPHGN